MNTPPLPPNSAPQPSPDPRRTPLAADEVALSAALQELPASAPSAELDARILAMARAALAEDRPATTARAPQRRARRRSLPWWMGTAAGAVMAAGIGWQMGGFGDSRPAQRGPGPAAEARPAAANAANDMEILIIPRRESESAAPAETTTPGRAQAPAGQTATSTERAFRRRELSNADASPPPLAEAVPPPPASPAAAPAPAAAAAPAPEPAQEVLDKGPASPQAAGSDDEGDAYAQPILDRIEVTGTSTLRSEGFPPVSQDFRLAPEEWLQRVRDRRDSGDLESARRSVREFARAHPLRVLPKDLRQLLNDSP